MAPSTGREDVLVQCACGALGRDGGVKSTHPDLGAHVVKLPGGVGVYQGSWGKWGHHIYPSSRTLAISDIAPEGHFVVEDKGDYFTIGVPMYCGLCASLRWRNEHS